jgi:hypothetical protein
MPSLIPPPPPSGKGGGAKEEKRQQKEKISKRRTLNIINLKIAEVINWHNVSLLFYIFGNKKFRIRAA